MSKNVVFGVCRYHFKTRDSFFLSLSYLFYTPDHFLQKKVKKCAFLCTAGTILCKSSFSHSTTSALRTQKGPKMTIFVPLVYTRVQKRGKNEGKKMVKIVDVLWESRVCTKVQISVTLAVHFTPARTLAFLNRNDAGSSEKTT